MRLRPNPLAWLVSLLLLITLLPLSALAGPAPVRLTPYGDQLTRGYGVSGGYRVWLRDRIEYQDYTFVGSQVDDPQTGVMRHEGHLGYTVNSLRLGAKGWLKPRPTDVVLLLAGLNDLVGWQSVAATATQYAALLDALRANTSALIMVGTVPQIARDAPSPKIAQFNALLPGIVAGRPGVILVDTGGAITSDDWMPDGVVPRFTYFDHIAGAYYEALDGAGLL